MHAEAEQRKREDILWSEGEKGTSRAKSVWPEEKQQDWDCVEQQSSVQDPGAHSQQEEKMSQARNRSTN